VDALPMTLESMYVPGHWVLGYILLWQSLPNIFATLLLRVLANLARKSLLFLANANSIHNHFVRNA
jgi:hypothetical protein